MRSCRILPEGSSQIWMPWSCVAVAASFPEGEIAQRPTFTQHITPSFLFTCMQPVGDHCSPRKAQQHECISQLSPMRLLRRSHHKASKPALEVLQGDMSCAGREACTAHLCAAGQHCKALAGGQIPDTGALVIGGCQHRAAVSAHCAGFRTLTVSCKARRAALNWLCSAREVMSHFLALRRLIPNSTHR